MKRLIGKFGIVCPALVGALLPAIALAQAGGSGPSGAGAGAGETSNGDRFLFMDQTTAVILGVVIGAIVLVVALVALVAIARGGHSDTHVIHR